MLKRWQIEAIKRGLEQHDRDQAEQLERQRQRIEELREPGDFIVLGRRRP